MITSQKGEKLESTRTAFGETILQLAEEGYDVVGIAADTSKSMRLDILEEKYHQRVYEVGIAEQAMVMIAAGLASVGKIPFVASYSVFTSMRSLEQLRTFVAYPRLNVKIIAGLGGFTAGLEGPSHIALEDLGIISCIPNMCLINPADATATRKAVRAAVDYPGPVYVRIGRDVSPVLFGADYEFEIGKANLIGNTGSDVTILATGFPVFQALKAMASLSSEGIGIQLFDVHTIRPLDCEAVLSAASRTGAILIVQEHYRTGGLASVAAELLSTRKPVPIEVIGVDHVFTQTALPSELRDLYGLTVRAICDAVRRLCTRKENR
jgi:transketolase